MPYTTAWVNFSKAMTFITPLELAYRSISQPSSPKPARAVIQVPEAPGLTRDDVVQILQGNRSATLYELQSVIASSQRYRLSTWERDKLGVQLGIALAEKARGIPDRNSQFIHDVLDYTDTPFGMLANRSFFEREYRRGAMAISHCANHHPPRCECWAPQRQVSWHVQNVYGDGTPEAYAAEKLWSALDELETATRPERGPGLT